MNISKYQNHIKQYQTISPCKFAKNMRQRKHKPDTFNTSPVCANWLSGPKQHRCYMSLLSGVSLRADHLLTAKRQCQSWKFPLWTLPSKLRRVRLDLHLQSSARHDGASPTLQLPFGVLKSCHLNRCSASDDNFHQLPNSKCLGLGGFPYPDPRGRGQRSLKQYNLIAQTIMLSNARKCMKMLER